jgi:hypothetical protein
LRLAAESREGGHNDAINLLRHDLVRRNRVRGAYFIGWRKLADKFQHRQNDRRGIAVGFSSS